jgi:hypothetical protein
MVVMQMFNGKPGDQWAVSLERNFPQQFRSLDLDSLHNYTNYVAKVEARPFPCINLSSKFLFIRIENEFQITAPRSEQGCQMVCFQTKNTKLGKFCRALEWKKLAYSMDIWNIFYINLLYVMTIRYFSGNLVNFHLFWYFKWRKIWQPRSE